MNATYNYSFVSKWSCKKILAIGHYDNIKDGPLLPNTKPTILQP